MLHLPQVNMSHFYPSLILPVFILCTRNKNLNVGLFDFRRAYLNLCFQEKPNRQNRKGITFSQCSGIAMNMKINIISQTRHDLLEIANHLCFENITYPIYMTNTP